MRFKKSKIILFLYLSCILIISNISTVFAEEINNTNTISSDITTTFNYTGDVQTFTAPYTGTYKLEVAGAQGGGIGGKGGDSSGTIKLTQGEVIYIYVGNQPTGTAGGFNGGGSSISYHGGGGATDIRKNGSGISNRVIVAGGGGGGVDYASIEGGSGGGMACGNVQWANTNNGVTGWSNSTGATQTSSFVYNRESNMSNTWYSHSRPKYDIYESNSGSILGWTAIFTGSLGQGADGVGGGGGGGSSYIKGVQNGKMERSSNTGNGYAKISYGKNSCTVNHYQMDTDGTNYSLYETETLYGIYDNITPSVKTYTGFTSPSTQTIKLTDEGVTVNYYYTRNKYKFTLGSTAGINTSGSTSSGSYYYGSTITLKASNNNGYNWNNWISSNTSLINNLSTANTTFNMPAGNITMTPNKTLVNYNITYNLDGGNLNIENPINYNIENEILLNNPIKENYDFIGWTGSNGTTPQMKVLIDKGSTGDKTYIANWKLKPFTITIPKILILDNKGIATAKIESDIKVGYIDLMLDDTMKLKQTNKNDEILF